ncbi:hypothetical protein V2J09_007733 [Rumex salicifolius]
MSAEQFSDTASRVELLSPASGGWSNGIRQMEGSENAIDAWRSLAVSPKGFLPRFMSDPCFVKSYPDVSNGERTLLESNCKNDDYNSILNSEKKLEQNENGLSSVVGTDSSPFKFGGSIAERRAAKFGFDASKINTSSFNSSSSLSSLASSSPYLLRTPGISPGALLESPMMLPNLQPSPTTGAFGFPHLANESGMIMSVSSNAADKNSDDTFSFTFNPKGKSIPFPCYSAMQNQYPPTSLAQNSGVEFDLQHSVATLPPVTGVFQFPTQLPSEATVNTSEFHSPPESKISSDMAGKAISDDFKLGNTIASDGFEKQQNECNQGEVKGNSETDNSMEGDQRIMDSSRGVVGNSEDGYNWRKYGQKQVKASEFPRSYYKCTHPSCPVKKKVEHSNEGQIIEIVYKGAHNHPKLLQPNRRSVSCGGSLNNDEGGGSVKYENGAGQRDLQHGYDDLKLGLDRRPDGLERTCSASIITDVSNPLIANEGRSSGALESAGTPELSSTLASNEEIEEEDAATQGSTVIVDNEEDEPDLKRRKMESSLIETALASRAIREPRVIVQIESEVDILDDGYRWRKYGQKVVKGNPNPRSYYKCTHPGCSVRKHVERASHNLKFVLTTYEGKHHHEVPSARNSSHANSTGGNLASSANNPQPLSQNSHLPKSEPQDFATHSNRRVEYNKDFLKGNYLGNFAGGAATGYQVQFPTFPNNMLYTSFGLNPNYESTTSQANPNVFALSSNMATHDVQGRPLGMMQPIFMGQPPKEGESLQVTDIAAENITQKIEVIVIEKTFNNRFHNKITIKDESLLEASTDSRAGLGGVGHRWG